MLAGAVPLLPLLALPIILGADALWFADPSPASSQRENSHHFFLRSSF
jgi:hypothetical protein